MKRLGHLESETTATEQRNRLYVVQWCTSLYARNPFSRPFSENSLSSLHDVSSTLCRAGDNTAVQYLPRTGGGGGGSAGMLEQADRPTEARIAPPRIP